MLKKSVLIIMKKNENFFQLEEQLLRNGFEVISETSGKDGYETARTKKPDLIISELQLNNLSGIDLCYMIRSNSKLSKIPFVLFTHYMTRDERIAAYRNGIDAVFTSSVSMQEAVVRIENILTTYESLAKDGLKPTQSLTGKLTDFKLVEILQLLNINQKTGILTIYHDFIDGQIVFKSGEIKYALIQDLSGEEAIHKMIEWESGTFIFELGEVDDDTNIYKPTMQLILDSCQIIDESSGQAS